MAEASVGDIVMVMSSFDGQSISFKSIVSVPHGNKNSVEATFLEITTVTGKSIQMTSDHLVLGGHCDTIIKADLVLASSLTHSTDCLYTIDGKEEIVSITQFVSQGIYSVVTESADDLLVVNGIIASPFSGNHQVANAFYNIVRVVNSKFFLPAIMKSLMLRRAIALFGDVVASI